MKSILKKSVFILTGIALALAFLRNGSSAVNFSVRALPAVVVKTGPGLYSAEIIVKTAGFTKDLFSDTPVILPLERFFITGPLEHGALTEKNILYSGISLDLDKNGAVDGIHRVTVKTNNTYMGEWRVEPVLSRKTFSNLRIYSYYRESGDARYSRIGKNGIPFILYDADPVIGTASLGIGGSDDLPRFREYPNPHIQIMVARVTERTDPDPAFAIEGVDNHLTRSNEKIFENQGDDWIALAWSIHPLVPGDEGTARISVTLKNLQPPFAVLSCVNASLERGIRLMSQRSVTLIER